MRFIIISFTALLISLQSLACLNLYHVDSAGHGSYGYADDEFDLPGRHDTSIVSRYTWVSDLLRKKFDFRWYSDYGVVLLDAGYFEEGLEVMRFLNEKYPNQYNIVANLGTAYELNGKNDSALLWINRAIRLNTGSHGGSEWIHKRILEAKLKMQKDPTWLSNHKVFTENDLQQNYVLSHFRYQLHERIPFTPAPDELFSEVLEEYGDQMLAKVSVSEAWKIFAVAKVYNPANPGIDQKIENARKLTLRFRAKPPKKTSIKHWATDSSVNELVTAFQQHRMVKMTEVKPVMYH